MNRSSSRISKKKAIPLYFKKSHSNSQFLATANYKHQIKTLKKTNKELARSLQDAKCRVADHEKALAECSRENTQTMFVKIKIKDIVETVQKLVSDLGVVYDELDGKSFDFLRNLSASHQENRLKIRHPSLSTIDESASMSAIESDLNKDDSLSVESFTRPTTPSIFDADSSQTEIYNVPLVLASEQKLQNVSNGSAAARSSKSLERTGSIPLNPDSPPTPQLKPITCTTTAKSTAKSTISKIPLKKQIASNKDSSPLLKNSSSRVDRRKTFVVDGKAEPQTSLPVSDKRDMTVLNSLAIKDKSDTFLDQRGTCVLNSLPDNAKSDIISDRRGTFVLSSLLDNAKSDIISDRRDTFVLSSLQDNAKSGITSDRRGTFVLNSLTDDTKPDTILDRRATYFIPPQSYEQPDTSPPKVTETPNPVQNAAPNQTILLCEDMELTEIIPLQNQSRQFISVNPPWNEKLETEQPGLSENLSVSVRCQPPCTTSVVKQFPVPNANSSNQLKVSIKHGALKDSEIQNSVSVKKDNGNKLLTSDILPETKLKAETSAPNKDVNLSDLQRKRSEETNLVKNMKKKESIDANIKSPKPPSPIAYYAKPDMSIQHKIFESFSAISDVSDKNKPTFDRAPIVKKDVHKKSISTRASFSPSQPTVEKVAVKVDAESPKTGRRSSRNQNKCFATFFSDSDESINFDEDFVPQKRFSLKPGRKIINPNNNKVFVFKKNSKKQSIIKETPPDSSPDKPVDEDVKNDPEKDIFNFSASSEADKSPLTKSKKRRSVMPKSNKRSVNKQSDVGKRLSKRASKRSSKPEVNKDEVLTALPRKSILCLDRVNSPLPLRLSSKFSRKSVRFTLVGTTPQNEINNSKCDSPIDENVPPVNQESDDIHDTEKVSSHNTRTSQGKRLSGKIKCISARSNSLKATGDILKSSSTKSKGSRKRQLNNLYLDCPENAFESDCSPMKKMFQVSNEIPSQKSEIHTNLRFENQEQSKDVKNNSQPSQDIPVITSEVTRKKSVRKNEKNSGLPNLDTDVKAAVSTESIEESNVNGGKRPFSSVTEFRSNTLSVVDHSCPSVVHEDKLTDRKKVKSSGRILSELPENLEANEKCIEPAGKETNVKETKRPFSLVSERRSKNKQSIADELFPSLNDAVCEMVEDNVETPFRLVEDELNEIYDVKEMNKFRDADCNQGNLATTKTPKQKSGCGKKKSSKRKKTSAKQSKDKENLPYSAENNLKIDVLTNDNDLCTMLETKECLEKAVVKPKISRKKKESTTPLLQNDLKVDALASDDTTGSGDAVGGRSRRNRKIISFKEPNLHSKMRRE